MSAVVRIQLMLMARKNQYGEKTDLSHLTRRYVPHRAHDSADGVQSGSSIQGENLDDKTEGHGMAGPRTDIEVRPQELERIRHSEAVPDYVKA